jgi:hypothetical protein
MYSTYSPTNDAAQGVPGTVIKPVQETVKTMVCHVMSGSVIEPAERETTARSLHVAEMDKVTGHYTYGNIHSQF